MVGGERLTVWDAKGSAAALIQSSSGTADAESPLPPSYPHQVRVGDFYECCGWDAVLMVRGARGTPPEARMLPCLQPLMVCSR